MKISMEEILKGNQEDWLSLYEKEPEIDFVETKEGKWHRFCYEAWNGPPK